MIQANELRIGNLVLNDGVDNIVENLLSDGQLTLKTKQGNYIKSRYERIKPIPLTEEWLLKFGFKRVDDTEFGVDYRLECTNEVFMCFADDFSLGLYSSEHDMLNGLAVIPNWEMTKHVHQLQNLYFALTGEELTIKE